MQQWRGRQAQWWNMVHEMDLYERPQSWKEYDKVVANYKQWEEAQRTSDGAGSCSSTTTTEINRIRQQQGNLLRFKGTLGGKKMLVLIDSGATVNFISQDFCERNGIHWRETGKTQTLHMADGSTRHEPEREVKTYKLCINEFKCQPTFRVTKLGRHDIILGVPWLRRFKPQIK